MPIARIDILCECENPNCSKRFGVELEVSNYVTIAGYKGFLGDLIEGMVRERILNGNGTYYTWAVRGKATVDRVGLSGPPSIQGGLILCDECTKKCDAAPKEGNLTAEEVYNILWIGLLDDDGDDLED